ncbi:MAG TPA: Rrf2 family transcriptional regulator [Bryobacteraceae bacterium]|nr:Rrf2 family transcriptional regulator [Bryobacteraceae bacterium]
MKITAQEEYGIRCLMQLGRGREGASLTIAEISRAEGISKEYVAKLMRVLRKGSLVRSVRGQAGGYVLARPLDQIGVSEALSVLGGRLYDPQFCDHHSLEGTCSQGGEGCSVRHLWRSVQDVVDQVLARMTLADLLKPPAPPPPSSVPQLTTIRLN